MAGVKRCKATGARETVGAMLAHMTNPASATHLHLPPGTHHKQAPLYLPSRGYPVADNVSIISTEKWLGSSGCQPPVTSSSALDHSDITWSRGDIVGDWRVGVGALSEARDRCTGGAGWRAG